jgi:fatty-acyl-CoA synthase
MSIVSHWLGRLRIRMAVRMIDRARSLRDVQRFALRHHAGCPALQTPNAALSYGELDDMALRIASAWRAIGVRKGARVITLLPDDWQILAVRFAIIEAGAIQIGFSAAHPPALLLDAVRRLQPELVIIHRDLDRPEFAALRESAAGLRVWTCGVADGDLEKALANTAPVPSTEPIGRDDALAQGFTSGTTGAPKLLVMNHDPFLQSLRLLLLNLSDPPQGRSRTLVGIPLAGAGSGIILPTMLGGGELILPRAYTSAALIEALHAHRPTHVFATPSLLIDLLDDAGLRDDSLAGVRQFIYGSASMPVAKLREALARFGQIFQQGYGMSEALPPVTMLPPRDHVDDRRAPAESVLSSSGPVARGVKVQVRDEHDAVLPAGQTGWIWVRTPTVFSGYPELPALNREVLRDGWYSTGDHGYFDNSDRLHVLDRRQNLIEKPEGRVYPRMIEERAHEYPAVKEAALVKVRGEMWLAVSLRRASRGLDTTLIERELRAHLEGLLPAWQLPNHILVMEELPRSYLAKLLHREIRDSIEASLPEAGPAVDAAPPLA